VLGVLVALIGRCTRRDDDTAVALFDFRARRAPVGNFRGIAVSTISPSARLATASRASRRSTVR